MNRVLVLGGGFGGIAASRGLRRRLPPDSEIVLIDNNPTFMVGFRKTWALLGLGNLEEGQRKLADLEKFGIQVIEETVNAIEPDLRAVKVGERWLEADALVVALGSQLTYERIPGYKDHALNIYDPEAIPAAAATLAAFSGGRVVIGIFGTPYKCPPAPYELALLTREYFNRKGVEVEISVFTPLPMSLPILRDEGCNVIEGRLEENGIRFLPGHQAVSVEANEVIFPNRTVPFDLLLGIAPHRCPDVVVASRLARNGAWVQVNPRTLATTFPAVYSVGDVAQVMMANGKPLPKAGVFAEGQAKIVARRIAATLEGKEPKALYEGVGGCFLEVGGGKALMVEGEFLASSGPQVRLSKAKKSLFENKKEFERKRLETWFDKEIEPMVQTR
jgi:sulfide:quinone oxidoreductase